jgi:uncharacterized protein
MSAETSAPRATPVDAGERLHALDILRGLALFGMILVHFHQNLRLEVTGVEDLIAWGVWVLAEQKAWSVFAFLFGVGFAVLLRRLEARGASIVPIYLRRLGMLAVFGFVAEICFGYRILFAYAWWGLALLVVRRWSTRALLITAVLAACARPMAAEWLAIRRAIPVEIEGGISRVWMTMDWAERHGDYGDLVAAREYRFFATVPEEWQDMLPDANLALFILGLLAVRHRILDEPKRHLRLIRGWMIFGALSWATSWLVLRHLPKSSIPGVDWPLAAGLGLIQEQWLCFTYIGAVVLLLATGPAWTARLAIFGKAGRLALTNYMLQAAVLDALASNYGLGLKLPPATYVAAAVILFALIAAISTAWLAFFRFGPLEWIWRTVTYARLQPIRREARVSAVFTPGVHA